MLSDKKRVYIHARNQHIIIVKVNPVKGIMDNIQYNFLKISSLNLILECCGNCSVLLHSVWKEKKKSDWPQK